MFSISIFTTLDYNFDENEYTAYFECRFDLKLWTSQIVLTTCIEESTQWTKLWNRNKIVYTQMLVSTPHCQRHP